MGNDMDFWGIIFHGELWMMWILLADCIDIYIYIYTLFCDLLIGNYGKIFWYDWYLWNLVKNPAVKGGSEGATGSFPDVNYIYVWYWNYGCLWRGKLWMIYGIWIDFPKTCNEDVWIFCGDNDDVNVPMYFRKKKWMDIFCSESLWLRPILSCNLT